MNTNHRHVLVWLAAGLLLAGLIMSMVPAQSAVTHETWFLEGKSYLRLDMTPGTYICDLNEVTGEVRGFIPPAGSILLIPADPDTTRF